MWTPALRRAWPEAPLTQLGDAGVGVTSLAFVESDDGVRRWGVEGAFAEALPALDPETTDIYRTDLLERIYAEALAAFPELRSSAAIR